MPEDAVTEPEDASLRTVVVAVAANLLIAVAKGVAAVLTGSAAMAAEATHSVADTCNEMLLYVGLRHGARPADDRHPFGYGQAHYFWSLLAAVGIFVIGGLFAIAQGASRPFVTPNRSLTCRSAWPCCWSPRRSRGCRGATWDDDGGRGLVLVGELATRWGMDADDAGKSVWFEVATRQGHVDETGAPPTEKARAEKARDPAE